jgi:hypothetical protein
LWPPLGLNYRARAASESFHLPQDEHQLPEPHLTPDSPMKTGNEEDKPENQGKAD